MSNELELLVPSKSNEITSTSSTSSSTSTKKEGESFFDKLLTKAKSDFDNVKTKPETNTNDRKIEVKEQSSDKIKNETKNNTTNEVKNNSLMDRLIQETKSNITDNKKETKIEGKTNNHKNEIKNTSLMDRLVAETKANIKDTKKEEIDEIDEIENKTDNLKNESKSDTNRKVPIKSEIKNNPLFQESKANVKDDKVDTKKDEIENNTDKLKNKINDITKKEIENNPPVQESKINTKDNKSDTKKIQIDEKVLNLDNLKNETKNYTNKNVSIKSEVINNPLLQESKVNAKDNKSNAIKSEVKENMDDLKNKSKNDITKSNTAKIEVKNSQLFDETKVNEEVNIGDSFIQKNKKSSDTTKVELKSNTLTNFVDENLGNAVLGANTQKKVDKPNNLKNEIKIDPDINNVKKEIDTEIKVDLTIKNTSNSSTIVNNIDEKSTLNKKDSLDNTINNNQKNSNTNKPIIINNTEEDVPNNPNSKNNLENDNIKTLNLDVKNDKKANDLPNLKTESKNVNINLNKDDLNSQKNKNTESLIDKLLDENSSNKQSKSTQQLIKNTIETSTDLSKSKNDLLTNIYMSTQKKSVDIKNLEVKHDGVEIAKNATSTKEVEKSAKVLNLGLEKVEIKIEKPTEHQNEVKLSSTFERLSVFKNTSDNSKDTSEDKSNKNNGSFLIESKKNDDNIKDTKLVNLTVSPAAAQTIQNRIIGARQNMSSMMSDLARVMYENYNPPVTAFRVNLNPSALGNIAILIRGDQKNNSLSISMKSSNNSTKENLVENQSMLKDSLFKSFAAGVTSFDLDFGSYEGNENSSNGQNMPQERETSNIAMNSNNKIDETEVKDTQDKYYM